jgi:hypothetical protein
VTKAVLEPALAEEMTGHLGCEKHDSAVAAATALAKGEMPGSPAARASVIHCGRSLPVSRVSVVANVRTWPEAARSSGRSIHYPPGLSVLTHAHAGEDEMSYLLAGELTGYCGADGWTARAAASSSCRGITRTALRSPAPGQPQHS